MRYMDLNVVMEGTQAEIRQFENWLHTCHAQGMFQQMVPLAVQPIFWRSFPNFTIQLDFTRPHHLQAHLDGIIWGSWSEKQNEKLSEHSAILYQGGYHRDSRDERSSDRDSDRGSEAAKEAAVKVNVLNDN
mmetsp:Transcript_4962/g.6847  ORF Transcript_4962/g.6847 Transcript_4962/m.6847 type:complete len:131 (+) Transcript_4962:222-614(+)